MYFELSIEIERTPAEVFAFFRDKDQYPQEPDSPVLALEKTTEGPPDRDTRYREVIQMLPFIRGEIHSVITRFEPPHFLEEEFEGAGMRGVLLYEFLPNGDKTTLIQRETLEPVGLLWFIGPIIRKMLYPRLKRRLVDIKLILDRGWKVNLNRKT